MNHQWLASVIAVLAIGVGIAIAGLPTDEPADAVDDTVVHFADGKVDRAT